HSLPAYGALLALVCRNASQMVQPQGVKHPGFAPPIWHERSVALSRPLVRSVLVTRPAERWHSTGRGIGRDGAPYLKAARGAAGALSCGRAGRRGDAAVMRAWAPTAVLRTSQPKYLGVLPYLKKGELAHDP